MGKEKLQDLKPEKRKKLILQLLSDLTQRRDALEDEIRQLCRLWDETVAELNGNRSPSEILRFREMANQAPSGDNPR
jgi:hypothetical protein